MEERLIQLGVLKEWELIQAEEDQENDDEEAPEVADEGKGSGQVQNNERAQTNVDEGSGFGERVQSEFVVARDDEEKMDNQIWDTKEESSSWFNALLSVFSSKEAPMK